jgi:hypothetical protein
VIVPSGLASARYSPPLASAKFVCGYPAASTYGVVSPVAKTILYPPAGTTNDGNVYSATFDCVSVRCHPARSIAVEAGL